MLQLHTITLSTEHQLGDRVKVRTAEFDLEGIIGAVTMMDGDEEPVALVRLREGFWGWRGSHSRTDDDEAFTYITTLVVSISNLIPADE